MAHSIEQMARPVRRRLEKVVQTHPDGDYRRRAGALLLLSAGERVSAIARYLQASANSVRKWRERYRTYGEAGLVPEPRGCKPTTVSEALCAKVLELVGTTPGEYGYLRSRWTSEMLADQLYEQLGVPIHASTVRRLLPTLGVVWNRARPTLHIPDRQKARKMRQIKRALARADAQHPVFYVDEVDIDLNPRLGHGWMCQGQQTTVPTPGKNQKRYLAGALNAESGKVTWVEWEKKNSELFIQLLAELRKRYRQAKKITVIADNYVIHKSAMTACFLRHNTKFTVVFQPAYHPWVNKIELLWKQLHDTVTRNHRHATMASLMTAVRIFMDRVSPYPGANVQLARV